MAPSEGFLLQGFIDKHFLTRVDESVVAGLGFTTIVVYYFKPVKGPRKK
jgi:hypothetical protein